MSKSTFRQKRTEVRPITITDYSSFAEQHQYTTTCLYLLGGDLQPIKDHGIPIDEALWKKLSGAKATRIVSTLCRVRTSLILHKAQAESEMKGKHSIYKCEAINTADLKQLERDNLTPGNWPASNLAKLVKTINVEIGNRLGACEPVNIMEHRAQVKNLILMPNGKADNDVAAFLKLNLKHPMKKLGIGYMNLKVEYDPAIWKDDKALLAALSGETVNSGRSEAQPDMSPLNKFLDKEKRVAVYVDCENADPFRFCAAMNCVADGLRKKISKIVLIRDVFSSTAWERLKDYVPFTVETVNITRTKAEKSRTDGTLIAEVTKARYNDNVKAFIVSSSDSDMGCLISSLKDAKFLFLLERDKSGPAYIKEISSSTASFCIIDNMDSKRAGYYYASSVINGVDDFEIQLPGQLRQTMERLRSKLDEGQAARLISVIVSYASAEVGEGGSVRLRVSPSAQPAIAKLWSGTAERAGRANIDKSTNRQKGGKQ